jgi:pilus assembly protein TadC
VIPAVLLGLAVLVLLTPPRARMPVSGEPERTSPVLPRAACALAGLALAGLVGSWPGLGLGITAALAGPRLLARLDDTESEAAELTAVLPLALDLLAACLAGGAAPEAAVSAVALAFPGPCGTRLHRVAAALRLGSAPGEAWAALGTDRDAAGAAARALARAAEGGAPVAGAVQRVASDARRRQQAAAHRRAARAGVLAVLPLGACFLPAFVLLGVVPAVVGLAGPLLRSLA